MRRESVRVLNATPGSIDRACLFPAIDSVGARPCAGVRPIVLLGDQTISPSERGQA